MSTRWISAIAPADAERYARMNVAITRARRHLVVVGDGGMLHQNERWKDIIQRANALPGGRHDAREYQVSSTSGIGQVVFIHLFV
jgi:hypothetical protein